MKKKRLDLITEGIREKIKQEPFDHNEEVKPQRSKWIRWLLNIIDSFPFLPSTCIYAHPSSLLPSCISKH